MIQSLVTVIVEFPARREASVNALLDTLGNPAQQPLQNALDAAAMVHFMSQFVVPARGEEAKAHLVIEVCADGHPKAVLERLVAAIPAVLMRTLGAAGFMVPEAKLGEFLERRCRRFGHGLQDCAAGLEFCGTPGMSVRRILDEARLAAEIRRRLQKPKNAAPGSALVKLQRVRARIFENVDLKWAFLSEPVPLLGNAMLVTEQLWPLIKSVFRDFLWPLVPVPALVFLISRLVWGNGLDSALWHLVIALVLELLLAGAIVLIGYRILRRQEEADAPFDVEPRQVDMREILRREDAPGTAQNHLGGVSIIKPGVVRYVTLRLALWLIGEHGTRRSKPGHIDKIGTIHFARWLQLPGTDKLVFLSNYDGSWQSYLEDFIARLRDGLTSVWSNTRDFPKTANLVAGGAGDGARFKRWARRQQQPTRFWYSAYPQLTTSDIRANAAIRHGFASASNERDAAKWLALFGYSAPETVETDEVPTLVFGGLAPLRFARCLIVRFPGREAARTWLREIERENAISYGDSVPGESALVVGLSRRGLLTLGLDDEAMATFPIAFQQGMFERANALRDQPGKWTWGGTTETEPHALLMLYASSDGGLAAASQERLQRLQQLGCGFSKVRLSEIPEDRQRPGRPGPVHEAFGFRDGISQPHMRGSKRRPPRDDPLNTVEPGELVLGYRDNLGVVAPLPRSRGRDIGRNGSYLVVRQLAQETGAFWNYLVDTAWTLKGDPRVPDVAVSDLVDWLGAKMVGRWGDGTSLVRYPDGPGMPEKATRPDNDFQFGSDDPDGLRCPLGAHIRRANPRDSFDAGSQIQIDISNRHRILRVGRNFEPEPPDARPGLLFMCVNADIERQFEFLQQTWILGPSFHGLPDEIDPVVGYRGDREAMTVPTPKGPVRLTAIARFVTMLGGGYFFMPGRSAMRILASN